MFYASFEQPADIDTRVYANEDFLLRWNADDRVSIFNTITYNEEYRFTGETGDNGGSFSRVNNDFITGNTIPHVVSVYPYQKSTKITEDEVLTVTLPAEQTYAENTFGLGANTMVSVSSDNVLQYKNIGGFLMLKLYGEGSVSSITLKGNNGEKLAGKASVTMPQDGVPTVSMADDAETEITLTCPEPVALGATGEESIHFWFVVPPVTFEKGFTITVAGDDGVFTKTTEKALTIDRNSLSKMSPIEVDLSKPKNVIYYTSSDGNVITPVSSAVFGANIISNEYADGRGIITFDADVISIGNWAFTNRNSLTSITIPESVTSIGEGAFSNCNGLTSITIPKFVTSIGDFAFYRCSELTSITLPDSVITIGNYSFQECNLLIDITIPESVTSIGNQAFSGCLLTDIIIPESVISIGRFAFSYCNYLTSINIPESVTSLGEGAFAACASLVRFSGKFASQDGLFLIDSGYILSAANGAMFGRITIPDGIITIGDWAFFACRQITDIIIPESVNSIGEEAFSGCSGLTSITVLPQTPPMGNLRMLSNTNDCPIYVPDGSVEAYKSAQYWSDYSYRIQAISQHITIDGDMSDWDCIEGATGEGISSVFKVSSDVNNIYFYFKRTTQRMDEIWGGTGYHYYTFDMDGDPATGEELWGSGPYEMILVIYPYAGSKDAPVFGMANSGTAVPSSCTVANAVIKGTITDSGVETEIAIPRSDLLAMPSTPVTVYSWSNKGGMENGKLSVTCTL